MKTIPATLGYSAIVDDDDYERLREYRWYAHNTGGRRENTKRPARRTGTSEGRKVIFLVHHIVSAPAGMVVDHINGNPWDNRKANLRVCTHQQNMLNQRMRRPRGDLVKGVYRRANRFWAKITMDGIHYEIGNYDTIEEAGLAYDAAALFLHGEFAALNFPDRGTEAVDPSIIAASWERKKGVVPDDVERALILMRSGMNSRQAAEATGAKRTAVQRHAAARGIAAQRGRPRRARPTEERA